MDQVFIMMIFLMILIKAMMIWLILMMRFMMTSTLFQQSSRSPSYGFCHDDQDDADDEFCGDFCGFTDDSDNNENFESKTFNFH